MPDITFTPSELTNYIYKKINQDKYLNSFQLIGEVSKIGANTILNEQDGMSYYPIEIIIRDKTFDMAKDTEAEFIPGMEASVE